MASLKVISLFSILAIVLAQAKANSERLELATGSFAQYMYQKVSNGKTESFVFSPFSIHTCLSMAYLGTNGTSSTEMSAVLGYNDVNTVNDYSDIIDIYDTVTTLKLDIGNGLFVEPQLEIKEGFKQRAASLFKAKVDKLDFQDTSGPERKINQFVSQVTNGTIEELMSLGSLGLDTRAVLVNALYFKGKWVHQFQPFRTHKANFTKFDGVVSEVDMMSQISYFSYEINDELEAKLVLLPFENTDFGFVVALPNEDDGISDLENKLSTVDILDVVFGSSFLSSYQSVDVNIPKFRIETSLDLKRILAQDMPSVFDSTTANFDGLSDERLWVSKAEHKAVIDVTESGIEAAAATQMSFTRNFLLQIDNTFVADHPFVFFLVDNARKQILFQGKFTG